MKKILLSFLLLSFACACARGEEPSGMRFDSDSYSSVKFPAPASGADRNYLGLPPDKKEFALSDIQADVLIVEVMNIYCTFCQKAAPNVNAFHELAVKDPSCDKVRFIGIGKTNTEFEVGVFRKKYGVSFPIVQDPDKTVSMIVGKPKTPSIVVLKRGAGKPELICVKEKWKGDPKELLEEIKQKCGLKGGGP